MFESKVFVTMVLILIFGEVLGLYGYAHSMHYLHGGKLMTLFALSSLIVALIMNSRAGDIAGVVSVLPSKCRPCLTLPAVHRMRSITRTKQVAMERSAGAYPLFRTMIHAAYHLSSPRTLVAHRHRAIRFYSHVLYCAYNTTFGRTACISTT